MNGDQDKSANSALRSQKHSRTQTVCVRKKKEDAPSGVSSRGARPGAWNQEKKTAKPAGTSSGKVSSSGGAENRRKLSDASNASEDMSKDSGCVSGKVSSSDCSSETSECPSENNKRDSPTGDRDLIWIDGKAYVKPGNPCAKAGRGGCELQADGAAGNLSLFNCSGTFMELMMGESTEDLLREVEDLRSENEYLKDELEELRCEMLEMRDLFQEEEMFQLQELRLQLEQANKTCRILQYRLRKAERRSIRVAQSGQVDGELVKSLEHDIKVAKSVSLRLYNELEAVQKKNSQLEWTNETLSEKIQQLEVVKQVLQAEVEKSRENTLKKKGSSRSAGAKAERRLSHHSEDDSADLRCQLHFAKEELAVMCKKLAKLVSEGEDMREQLAMYQSAYGDVDVDQSPGDKHVSVHSREAEVRVHLKLVEEEATLLSRRIVELEVENRGLRAEMSDLRERSGGGGGGEEEEKQQAVVEKTAASAPGEDDEEREGQAKVTGQETGSCESGTEIFSEEPIAACHVTQEVLVGGDNPRVEAFPEAVTAKDYAALVALREHCCILNSAIHFLTAPLKNGCSSAPSCVLTSPPHMGKKPGFLLESLELIRDMLLVFSGRLETFLTGRESGKDHGPACDPSIPSALCTLSENTADCDIDHNDAKESPREQEDVDKLPTAEDKERSTSTHLHSCRNPKIQLYLQILWILHQWYHGDVPEVEVDQGKNRTMSVLRGLLLTLVTEFQDEPTESGGGAKAAESADGDVIHGEDEAESSKVKQQRQHFPLQGSRKKNWCYLDQEAAQLDQREPVKLWDHPIMPQSFPDFDSEQTFTKRSHTAPEKSAFRIYYSPPSARRVQLSQLRHGPVTDGESVHTSSPWCTPLTSLSQLCLGSSTNLSDDVKEMTASWRRTVRAGSQEAEHRSSGRWVDVVCSSTQTHMKPQMVSVGLQTEGPVLGRGPSRLLAPGRSHHTSLDGRAGRSERLRASASSPKLYHRHSGPPCFSLSPSSSTSSTSSSSSTKDRAPWNLNHENTTSGPTWTKQGSPRQTAGSPSRTKPPTKPPGPNCYGVVTEFLRRVSGRAEKPVPGPEQKTRSGLKNLECAPTRTPAAASLRRSDSVTRIVNQRFMKQREEGGRAQREGQCGGTNASVRPSVSRTSEDGVDQCSSRRTLTFCFTRPSPSTRRQASNLSKVPRQRCSQLVSAAAAANCET